MPTRRATHPTSQNATIRRAKQRDSTSACNTTDDLGAGVKMTANCSATARSAGARPPIGVGGMAGIARLRAVVLDGRDPLALVSRIGLLLRPRVNAASGAAVTQGDHHGQVPVSRRSPEPGAVSELQGIARFKIHQGRLEEFKRLSAQCVEIVRTKDTGTLQYEIYFNDDQSECIVLERYTDAEALIEHLAHIRDLMEAIVATGSVSGEVLGEPSAQLRAKMADSDVRLFTLFQSM